VQTYDQTHIAAGESLGLKAGPSLRSFANARSHSSEWQTVETVRRS